MYKNRAEAGGHLAHRLAHLSGRDDVVVVGLPRGGVPVAYEVAAELGVPLDVILVRKLGVPFQPEVAMGAIGENGVTVVNEATRRRAGVSDRQFQAVEARERKELARRTRCYRSGRLGVPLAGRVVLVVDDGIATGSTAKAACQVARAEGASRVIMAVPVAPIDWESKLGGSADEMISLAVPASFSSVGQFYSDFEQTSDDEVISCLDRAAEKLRTRADADTDGPEPVDRDIVIAIEDRRLGGHLMVPEHPQGFVIFAHGSGSSRHSPRNRYVAGRLNAAGFATLLFDLLTEEEEIARTNVFDIGLLGHRLLEVTQRIREEPSLQGLPVAYFGASTGAAAALLAAADPASDVVAIVSRGGRPDLAEEHLASVAAPTLLIVGGSDAAVRDMNTAAKRHLTCEASLEIVPGATHLFEESGALEKVADLAIDWFALHSRAAPQIDSAMGDSAT